MLMKLPILLSNERTDMLRELDIPQDRNDASEEFVYYNSDEIVYIRENPNYEGTCFVKIRSLSIPLIIAMGIENFYFTFRTNAVTSKPTSVWFLTDTFDIISVDKDGKTTESVLDNTELDLMGHFDGSESFNIKAGNKIKTLINVNHISIIDSPSKEELKLYINPEEVVGKARIMLSSSDVLVSVLSTDEFADRIGVDVKFYHDGSTLFPTWVYKAVVTQTEDMDLVEFVKDSRILKKGNV